MLAYATRRLLLAIPLTIVASVIVFVMVATIRDPLAELRQSCPTCDESAYDRLIDLYDLDQDVFPQRYISWLGDTVTGDFGTATSQGERPVTEIFFERAQNTLLMAIPAFIIMALLATVLSVYSALRQYSFGDYLVTGVSYLGIALPTFFFGLTLQVFWGIWWPDWTGTKPFWTSGLHDENLGQLIGSLTLPIITLNLVLLAGESRFGRAAMLEVRNADYIRTARAKGVPERRVVFKHMLRNAMIPLVTVWALDFSALLGGSIVTETIFSWPGIGLLLVSAIGSADVDLVMIIVVFFAVLAVVFNLLADLAYGWLDPRIRYG